MASINVFKLLNQKCSSYFDIFQKQIGKNLDHLDIKVKERYGFYLFILESICNIKDSDDIAKLITDTQFNTAIFDIKDDDQGIDAIHIDTETNTINLFNFYFKEKFNQESKQSINKSILSTKFLNAIKTENTSLLNGKIKIFAEKIIKNLFYSDNIWKIKFHIVSNDSVELETVNNEISQLEDSYDIEIIPIGLGTISNIMSIRPEPIDAILFLNNDAVMPFEESKKSSSKSYILRLSATDLIRITCDNKELRNKHNIEDLSPLSKVNMDYNLLFDNVRGLIARSKFNENIANTLKVEPSKLFMYNNGLTITASDIISSDENMGSKIKLTLKDFQVVNGGQTLRTLHIFNSKDEDNISKYLTNCEILVRVFKTTSNDNIKNKIAEYTNSQNTISSIDLKSLSSEQIQIEQFLDENDIIYARKNGDVGISKDRKYSYKISMEKFGQILFSIKGHPEKASNSKKQIFEKYYNYIFIEDFDLSNTANQVRRYIEIKKAYDLRKDCESTDQKIFYILLIESYFDDVNSAITFLEASIKSFDKKIPDSRKVLQTSFKEALLSSLKLKDIAL